MIARSWKRSLQWSVSPGLRRFEEYRRPRLDEQLLQCAAPVLDRLDAVAADTGMTIYLADHNGTIAAVRGQTHDAKGIRVAVPGSAMAEDVTGTNSDGTALEEGRAVTVWGAEHFCEGMQHMCCTSVPVFDPLRHSVRAVLSLSMPERLARPSDARSMAMIAQGAAAELTQLLASRLARHEQALLASYMTEMRKRGADSVVVMDDRTTIANKGALQLLGQSDHAVLSGYARESERLGQSVEREITLGPGTTMRVQATPITTAGETIGSVLRLRTPKPRQRTGSRPAAPVGRADSFDGVVGESLALRRALEVARTVVRRKMPAYIVGERGTGKTHLALEMARELADSVEVIDGATCTAADGLAQRVGAAAEAGSAVVLRHADLLPDECRHDLADVLASVDNPLFVMTMTGMRDDSMVLANALAGVEIRMPALRSRRDDIRLLVAHFLAGGPHGVKSVSPQLLRTLTESDWTGNVAELKEFVDATAARCTISEIGVQHLSDAHQRSVARSPLSRLEEAELQQIREALADTRGNRGKAAELLQIGRSTLYRKIELYTRRGYVIEG